MCMEEDAIAYCKRYRVGVMAFFAIVSLWLALGLTNVNVAWADDAVENINQFKGTVSVFKYARAVGNEIIYEWKGKTTATRKGIVSDVESSNPKVASASVVEDFNGRMRWLAITVKNTGKSTVTYKLDGKKRTVNLRVQSYQNPVKSFKIDSKEYSSRFKKINIDYLALKSAAGKIVKVKAANGWKIKSLLANGKRVRNGSSLKKGCTDVCATLVNKKTKATQKVSLVWTLC